MVTYSSSLALAMAIALGIPTIGRAQRPGAVAEVYRIRPQGSATTIASMRRLQLEHDFGSQCEPVLVAEFAFGKDGPRSAQVVRLGIISSEFEGQRLGVEADGAAYDVGTLRRFDFVEYSWCRYMPPTVGVELDRRRFVAIAGSQRIVLHVGERAIPLEREHIDALHALALELDSSDDKPVLTWPPN